MLHTTISIAFGAALLLAIGSIYYTMKGK
jgi:hypothetical protein